MIRSFIAFELQNQEAIQNITEFTDRLKKNQSRIKPIEPENIHLTVKFLGNINESIAPKIYKIMNSKINQKLLKNQSYHYKLKGVGNFRNYSIIWIPLRGDIEFLQQVKDTIEESLNRELKIRKDKRRKFKPHITIARLKKKRIDYNTFDSFKALIKSNKDKDFGEFIIDEIKLKKSVLTPKGPIYSDLIY
ncbi:MAG: RNA 2',3'-cyclic phosphodiesterase [Candidatus Lokiarchaeota archaeon]|nr:RNA 2',3'-cyclic phosphodiesterase [Candidatus Lokiarchaeota archaeon]MBD3198500.1 RNA 2',3'-cyclic phosphodiesterase [Candidatus Lokiarchaeota archaeon]